MKCLVVGGGSMGRRRLRDLVYLNPGEIILFEPQAERCKEIAAAFGVRGFTGLGAALAEKPDVMIVCTPPALHEQYVRKGVEENLHVFAEVPFVLDLKALEEIAVKATSYPGVLGVSHTIRYYPPYRLIHDLLHKGAIGSPLYLEYSLGNYLPDWHPYEDYRTFYAHDAGLGGAGMDMILHEISAIEWWLGRIESVYARFSKLSSLEIRGADNHDVLISFASGARGFFHHDLIERGTLGRHVRIVGEEGTIEWHQSSPTLRVYHGPENQAQELAFDAAADWGDALAASREMLNLLPHQGASAGHIPAAATTSFSYESCYLREMRYFLNAVVGKHPFSMASLTEEIETVRVFHAIVRSSADEQQIRL